VFHSGSIKIVAHNKAFDVRPIGIRGRSPGKIYIDESASLIQKSVAIPRAVSKAAYNMSEHVHVHAPHELTESHGDSTSRSERVLELIATILLSLATLGIAWSGYQAARWNGRQAREYAQANTARSKANRAATTGDQFRTQDLLIFNR